MRTFEGDFRGAVGGVQGVGETTLTESHYWNQALGISSIRIAKVGGGRGVGETTPTESTNWSQALACRSIHVATLGGGRVAEKPLPLKQKNGNQASTYIANDTGPETDIDGRGETS